MSKQEQNRAKIISKYLENPAESYRSIGKQLGIPDRTVGRVVNRFKEDQTIARRPGSGGKPGFQSPSLARKILLYVKKIPSASYRQVGQKYGVSQTFVQKVIRKGGLNTYKVQKCPNRNDVQAKKAKIRARKLYESKLAGRKICIIVDDETYVVEDFKQLPGRGFYRAPVRFGVKAKFKYQSLSKYPKKYLVWQAICSCGLKSKAYIAKGTMTSDVYLEECLEKRLLPLIRSHKGSTLFWPDLATVHYSKKVQQWYESNGVNYVPKDLNPPNCPELRPVEKYWSIIKGKLRKSGKVAKNYQSFVQLWRSASRLVEQNLVVRLMAHLKMKIFRFSREPVDN